MDLNFVSVHKDAKKNLANIQPSWPHTWSITHIYLFLWSWAGGILRILQSDWFRERAVFSYLLTTVMVTNYAQAQSEVVNWKSKVSILQ